MQYISNISKKIYVLHVHKFLLKSKLIEFFYFIYKIYKIFCN